MQPALPAKTLILAALRYEAYRIAAVVGNNPTVNIHVVGPRAAHLPSPDLNVKTIIMAGLAGGIDPMLQSADVILDAPWLLEPIAGCTRGRIESCDQIIATPEEKSRLFEQTGASVVDMENAAARAFALRMNARFIGLRAVSDAADESLDPALLRIIDSRGRLKPLMLAGAILRRPALISILRRTGRQSHHAMQNLCDVLRRIVQSEQVHESPAPSEQ